MLIAFKIRKFAASSFFTPEKPFCAASSSAISIKRRKGGKLLLQFEEYFIHRKMFCDLLMNGVRSFEDIAKKLVNFEVKLELWLGFHSNEVDRKVNINN
jgi:hypothetical protein